MWGHFIRIICFFQKIYPIRIKYDKELQQFQPVYKTSYFYLHANAHYFQVLILSAWMLIDYLKTDEKNLTTTYPEFIINLLFLGLAQVCPATVWTLWKRKEELCYFLNQSYRNRKIRGKFHQMFSIRRYAYYYKLKNTALYFQRKAFGILKRSRYIQQSD